MSTVSICQLELVRATPTLILPSTPVVQLETLVSFCNTFNVTLELKIEVEVLYFVNFSLIYESFAFNFVSEINHRIPLYPNVTPLLAGYIK